MAVLRGFCNQTPTVYLTCVSTNIPSAHQSLPVEFQRRTCIYRSMIFPSFFLKTTKPVPLHNMTSHDQRFSNYAFQTHGQHNPCFYFDLPISRFFPFFDPSEPHIDLSQTLSFFEFTPYPPFPAYFSFSFPFPFPSHHPSTHSPQIHPLLTTYIHL